MTPRAEIELSSPEFPLVGWHVLWRISRVAIPFDDLRTLLSKYGFAQYIPTPPAPAAALQRAVAEWVDLRAAEGHGPARGRNSVGDDDDESAPTREQSLIRPVAVPPRNPFLVFALVVEAADLAELGLSYATSMRIVLHKETKTLICTTQPKGVIEVPKARKGAQAKARQPAPAPERAVAVLAAETAAEAEGVRLTRELEPLWEQHRELVTATECSRIIRRIVADMNSVATRGRGGVYFVPYNELDTLQRLNQLIGELPTPGLPTTSPRRPFLYPSGVIDRPAAKRQLAVALHAGIMDEVDAATKKLHRFTAQAEGTVRADTLLERLAEFRRVKQKASTYADLIGLQQESVQESLRALEKEAMQVVLAGDVELDPQTIASEAPTVRPSAKATPAAPVTDELVEMLGE